MSFDIASFLVGALTVPALQVAGAYGVHRWPINRFLRRAGSGDSVTNSLMKLMTPFAVLLAAGQRDVYAAHARTDGIDRHGVRAGLTNDGGGQAEGPGGRR